jgi:hypothetical protein
MNNVPSDRRLTLTAAEGAALARISPHGGFSCSPHGAVWPERTKGWHPPHERLDVSGTFPALTAPSSCSCAPGRAAGASRSTPQPSSAQTVTCPSRCGSSQPDPRRHCPSAANTASGPLRGGSRRSRSRGDGSAP